MKSEIMKDLSDRIRQCSTLVGSGDELARRTGMSRRTLEHYHTGTSEPSVSKIKSISDASGVSLEWLVAGNGPMMRDNLFAAQGKDGEPTSSLAHASMAVYATLLDAGKFIPLKRFEELTMAMWELDQQYGDNEAADPDDPIVSKAQRLLTAALKD